MDHIGRVVYDIKKFIAGDVNVDHWIKVMSAKFLHHKIIFPFVVDKYIGGDTLRLY